MSQHIIFLPHIRVNTNVNFCFRLNMPVCAVVGCFTGYKKAQKREEEEEKHQLFQFPQSPWIRNRWIERINRKDWQPSDKDSVCAKHFQRPDDYQALKGDRDKANRHRQKDKLKDNAVPSQHLKDPIPSVPKVGGQKRILQPKVFACPADLEHDHNYNKRIRVDPEPALPFLIDPDPTVLQVDPNPVDDPVVPTQPDDGMDYDQDVNVITDHQEFTGMELELVEDVTLTKKNYQEQLESNKKRIDLLEKENRILKNKVDAVGKIFTPDQIYRLQNPSTRMPYPDLTMQKIMQIYYACGSAGFKFLLKEGYPFADKSTIVRNMQCIDSDFGTQYDLIKITEMKISTMAPRDRKCALIIDEMAISPKREYDPSTGEIIGRPTLPTGPKLVEKRAKKGINNDLVLATHVLNVVGVGLVKFWKQLFGFHLTDASFCPKAGAKWLRELLSLLKGISLEVMLIVHDMGPTMVAL